MKIDYKPLGDYVLVKDETVDEKAKKSKIILTNSIERGDTVATKVLAVGPGIYTQNGLRIPMNVKVGDTVIYKKDIGGTKIKLDGEEYILFHEHELLLKKNN